MASDPKKIHSKKQDLAQMGDNFQALLWSSFKKVYGPIQATLSIIVALGLWITEPTQTISLKVAIPILIVVIIFMTTLIDTTYASFEISKKTHLPYIKQANKNEKGYIVCLLSPSELFSHEMLVSFYYRDGNSFERMIGAGHVEIIQEDRLIQVIILVYEPIYESILNQLAENDENIKRKIRVKPGASKYFIDRLYNMYEDYSG